MIFWFSGTGNSFAVARALAEGLNEPLMPLARATEMNKAAVLAQLGKGERIGFVYPVYAWGPPQMVLSFIRELQLPARAQKNKPYLFAVSTCGDEEGHATSMLQKALAVAGLTLDSAFTLRMPNNYVILYDVDPQEVAAQKLREARMKIGEMLPVLAARKKEIFSLIPGRAAALKTMIVNPLFNRYAMDATRFSVSSDCTKCGLCEDLCPTHNIVRNDGIPVWGNRCTQCLACLHQCPVHAIQYGRGTIKKGRYTHPEAGDMRNAMLGRDG